jgi:hypothetical protein
MTGAIIEGKGHLQSPFFGKCDLLQQHHEFISFKAGFIMVKNNVIKQRCKRITSREEEIV